RRSSDLTPDNDTCDRSCSRHLLPMEADKDDGTKRCPEPSPSVTDNVQDVRFRVEGDYGSNNSDDQHRHTTDKYEFFIRCPFAEKGTVKVFCKCAGRHQ